MSDARELPSCLTPLTEMNDAWAVGAPGARLEAVRRSARRLRDRIGATGPAISVRTFTVATFPYPTKFAFQGAALSPAPFAILQNRMHLVQVADGTRTLNVLVNPSDPERSLEAPFFKSKVERLGRMVPRRVLSRLHSQAIESSLRGIGVAPEDIDFVTFDHLHVQDVRGLLGTEEPEPGRDEPTPPLLPNARLLVQRQELETFEHMHPMHRYWYVRDGVRSVPRDKMVVLEGDYLIGGGGLALVRTPGHTYGNHTIVIGAGDGLWTVSENGVAVESYAPACSEIPGLRRFARDHDVEVVLNGNTREDSLDQYTSMLLEKTVADPFPDRPEFPQHFPSSELVKSRLAPGLAPTLSYRKITHGTVRRSESGAGAETSAA